MIYLDNAATTPLHPAVMQAMQETEKHHYFNANTLYTGGITAAKQIHQARQTLLRRLHATSGQLIFTSTATQANHLIMQTLIRRQNQHLITTAGDHNSVYLYAKDLQARGYTVNEVPLQRDGQIDLTALSALITPETALFVFSLVNSDVGTLQDAAAIVRTIRQKSTTVHIHADASQAFAKFDFDVSALGLDSVTICGHKINGPKGVGALWVRNGVNVAAPHGTLNNAAIVGLATAATVFDGSQVPTLHAYLVQHLPAGCSVNGINNNPYITNISLPHVYGETVLNALNAQDIYVGLGSACAAHAKGNRTLAAMKFTPEQQKCVLRVSLGTTNTLDDIKKFLAALEIVLPTISGYNVL